MVTAFVILAVVVLVASVMVIISRRTVQSALYLLVSFVALAGIFILLGAEFVAAVQVIVYAGSVVVLFVFVIMTVGFRESSRNRRSAGRVVSGIILGLVLMGELATALYSIEPGRKIALNLTSREVNAQLGKIIFSEWILPLEVFSLLIIAVMVGAAALKRERGGRQ